MGAYWEASRLKDRGMLNNEDWFWEVHMGSSREDGTPILCQNIFFSNICWYQKKTNTLSWAVQELDFLGVHMGRFWRRLRTPRLCQISTNITKPVSYLKPIKNNFGGSGGWYPQTTSKHLSLKHQLIQGKTFAITWAVQKIDFLGFHFWG